MFYKLVFCFGILYDLNIHYQDVEGVMEIRQYQLKSWQDTGPVPDSEFALLNVINRIQSWQHEAGSHPIIVHCM